MRKSPWGSAKVGEVIVRSQWLKLICLSLTADAFPSDANLRDVSMSEMLQGKTPMTSHQDSAERRSEIELTASVLSFHHIKYRNAIAIHQVYHISFGYPTNTSHQDKMSLFEKRASTSMALLHGTCVVKWTRSISLTSLPSSVIFGYCDTRTFYASFITILTAASHSLCDPRCENCCFNEGTETDTISSVTGPNPMLGFHYTPHIKA